MALGKATLHEQEQEKPLSSETRLTVEQLNGKLNAHYIHKLDAEGGANHWLGMWEGFHSKKCNLQI